MPARKTLIFGVCYVRVVSQVTQIELTVKSFTLMRIVCQVVVYVRKNRPRWFWELEAGNWMLEKRKAKTCKRENRASRGKYFNAGGNKSAIRQMIAEAVT